jgi:hypothetical protein
MEHNIEHYVYKDIWINDSLCDEIVTTLDKEDTWLPFPKDVVNAYPDAPRKQDGIAGSTLSIDWEQFIGDPNIPEQDRNYGICHMQNQELLLTLRERIQAGLEYYVHEYLEDIKWYDYFRGFTDPKFMKYQETHDMMEHCDHVGNAVGGKGIPTVSIVGNFGDDFEGGALRFWGTKDYYFKKGEIMFFPSNFLYPHRVRKVTKGLRYSFVSWVW